MHRALKPSPGPENSDCIGAVVPLNPACKRLRPKGETGCQLLVVSALAFQLA